MKNLVYLTADSLFVSKGSKARNSVTGLCRIKINRSENQPFTQI